VFGDDGVCGFPIDVKFEAVMGFCDSDVEEVDGVVCFFFHCELHAGYAVTELCSTSLMLVCFWLYAMRMSSTYRM
jgi:hypothetical protein